MQQKRVRFACYRSCWTWRARRRPVRSLDRLGWDFPVIEARLAGWHGRLMVAGVFGTVIARAGGRTARQQPFAAGVGGFAPPLFSAVGAALLFTERSRWSKCSRAEQPWVVIVYAVEIYRHRPSSRDQGRGARTCCCWSTPVGHRRPNYRLVYWWMGFLVLTMSASACSWRA